MRKTSLKCWFGRFILLCLLLSLAGLLFAVFFFEGAIEGDGFRIYEENGKTYVYSEKYVETHRDYYFSDNLASTPRNRFPTVKEMQRTILDPDSSPIGNFMICMDDLDMDTENGSKTVEMCDLRKVYDAVMPQEMNLRYVDFGVEGYYFLASYDSNVTMQMTTYGSVKGFVDEYYWQYYNDPQKLKRSRSVVLSVKDISDRNAREMVEQLEYRNGETVTVRNLLYTVVGWNGVVYVHERWENDTLGSYTLCGEDDGADFYAVISFSSPVTRPSEFWLASFGLRLRLDLLRPFAY